MRLALLAVLVTLAVPGVADAALCSADEHAAAVAKAQAYADAMPAGQKAYFKRHKKKAVRDAFLSAQWHALGRLRDAASCEVYDPAPAFTFGSQVGAAEQQEVRDDVAFALGQLRSLTGAPLRGPKIYVTRDSGQLAEWFRAQFRLGASAIPVKKAQYDSGAVTAEAGESAVFVVASSRSWEFANAANRQKIIAHELFHLVQQQLMNKPDNWGTTPSTQIRPSGPVWLTEGAAETIAYRVAAARGLFDLGQIHGSLVAQAPSWITPLNGFETYAGSGAVGTSWNTMWFAASRLLDTAPKGLASALDYWTAIGAGTAWRDAFAAAFGRSVDQFYAEFAAYRATL